MKAVAKIDYDFALRYPFLVKDQIYEIKIHSVLEPDDYASLDWTIDGHNKRIRFSLKNQKTNIVEFGGADDYIGYNELYFYDFFYTPAELRKIKLKKITNQTS